MAKDYQLPTTATKTIHHKGHEKLHNTETEEVGGLQKSGIIEC